VAHAGGEVAWEGWLAAEQVTPRSWSPGSLRPPQPAVAI